MSAYNPNIVIRMKKYGLPKSERNFYDAERTKRLRSFYITFWVTLFFGILNMNNIAYFFMILWFFFNHSALFGKPYFFPSGQRCPDYVVERTNFTCHSCDLSKVNGSGKKFQEIDKMCFVLGTHIHYLSIDQSLFFFLGFFLFCFDLFFFFLKIV